MRRLLGMAVALGLFGCVEFAPTATGPLVKYVDEFDLTGATSGYGYEVSPRRSVAGTPLTLGGVGYERGFGIHPESALAFTASGGPLAFAAKVGLDRSSVAAAERIHSSMAAVGSFRVWADGKVVWDSGPLTATNAPVEVELKLDGAREIVLETRALGEWTLCNAVHSDWAQARFVLGAGTTLARLDDPSRFAQLGVLTRADASAPAFHGADIWGVRPGRPVIFRVPVSGARPLEFSAKYLPEGVTLDGRGVLRGTAPTARGEYDIEVTAKNAHGSAVRTIRLAVGDTIGLTPPMGWNSWNTLAHRLTERDARAAAEALEASGLGDYGWAYVNLDDYWQMNNEKPPEDRPQLKGPARDAEGRIVPNPDFGDMRALTDFIHGFGFKAGIYSSPGRITCGGCEGSLGHELQDAESWARWGFDYVKYDLCSYGEEIEKENPGRKCWVRESWTEAPENAPLRESFVKPYRLMNECLKLQPRDVFYSYCQYGMAGVKRWARENGANSWRSHGDLKDAWNWMEMALDELVEMEVWKWCGPGCWADPDMMIVGRQFSFGGDHPTYLTPNEQYTHVSLWAMVGSPLLIGCDLTRLDAFTRSLLVNDGVIAISQDRLGAVARRIRHDDAESVWVKPLANGDVAVALVNRAPISHPIRIGFDEVNLEGGHFLRDVWSGECQGRHEGGFTADVLPHATRLLRIRAQDCPSCDERAKR